MTVSRRRFLTISAAFAGAATLGGVAANRSIWRGRALGADAEIVIYGDKEKVHHSLSASLDVIRRVEQLFSIYNPGSALSELNKKGWLKMPPEFVRLMSIVDNLNAMTGGLFDPTIQSRFEMASSKSINLANKHEVFKQRTGWHRVNINDGVISFNTPGVAVTLNGVAQGFATDRVSEVFKAHGMNDILVNVGEYRASGRAASIGIAGNRGELISTIELINTAQATSSPQAHLLPDGSDHIVHPDGRADKSIWKTVSVNCRTAAMADGLSTALVLARDDQLANQLVSAGFAKSILLENRAGNVIEI